MPIKRHSAHKPEWNQLRSSCRLQHLSVNHLAQSVTCLWNACVHFLVTRQYKHLHVVQKRCGNICTKKRNVQSIDSDGTGMQWAPMNGHGRTCTGQVHSRPVLSTSTSTQSSTGTCYPRSRTCTSNTLTTFNCNDFCLPCIANYWFAV